MTIFKFALRCHWWLYRGQTSFTLSTIRDLIFRSETKLNLSCTDHGLWKFPPNDFKPNPQHAWRPHQMETLSALLALCERNSPVSGEFPSQRPVSQSFDVFFDLRVNKRLSKQSIRRWFETPSCSFLRHCIKVYQDDIPWATDYDNVCFNIVR